MRRWLVMAALAAGAMSTTSGAERRDRNVPPAATAVGEPVDCVDLNRINTTRVYGDQTIDFILDGNRVYRNTLPTRCPGLGFEERFAYKTSIGRLCSVDIITVLQSPLTTPGASCGLGKFQPVKLANK